MTSDTLSRINDDSGLPSADDFRVLEKSRLQALMNRDMATALRLHAHDFHLVTPRGEPYSRERYLAEIECGELRYLQWTPRHIEVRVFAGVALLRYQADLQMGASLAEASSLACWHTDSYELRDATWQVVWSQATLIR